ncbi:MAG: AAA family ATPase [Anaerolineae bacterium]
MPACYQPRTRLTDPGWFYGRRYELQQVFSYLNKPSPQNVSVVGQRRIGKSWLLEVLALDAALRAEHLEEPDSYTFIYWDLQCEPRLSPDHFFRRLVDLLLNHLPPALATECREVLDGDELEDSLLEMLDLLEIVEHRVILLLDEFAAITRSTEFAETFFSHLRSIFSRPSMTCVTASYRSLGEMCHLGPDSPFFNIFSRIQLGLFTREEAEGFVVEPFQAEGVEVEPAAVRAILRLTGCHPCFISQLCHALAHEVRAEARLTREDVDRHNGPFQTSVFDDFGYYLQRLDEDELAMLRNIAEGNPPTTLENPVYIRLRGLSLVREEMGTPVPFSIPFSQFIKDSKGTDVYFEKAFSDTSMSGSNFLRMAEVMLAAAQHIPDRMRSNLEDAIRAMQGRPQDAMRICGRDVLDPLFDTIYRAEIGGRWDGNQYDTCGLFDDRAEAGAFPKHLAAHLHSVRIYGNHGSHPHRYLEACTPARAFLTVLETIHLAEEIGQRYGV